MLIPVNLVSEDLISEFTMECIIDSFSPKFVVSSRYGGEGFGYIKKKINGFNHAARITPYFVLTDLDQRPCPVQMRSDWIKGPIHENLIFRIAVREVEAWLLADREGMAEFLGVSIARLPQNPDLEPDPKLTILNIVKRSKRKTLQSKMLPIDQYASVGPNYNEALMEFVSEMWDFHNACTYSDSLFRVYRALDDFNLEN